MDESRSQICIAEMSGDGRGSLSLQQDHGGPKDVAVSSRHCKGEREKNVRMEDGIGSGHSKEQGLTNKRKEIVWRHNGEEEIEKHMSMRLQCRWNHTPFFLPFHEKQHRHNSYSAMAN